MPNIDQINTHAFRAHATSPRPMAYSTIIAILLCLLLTNPYSATAQGSDTPSLLNRGVAAGTSSTEETPESSGGGTDNIRSSLDFKPFDSDFSQAPVYITADELLLKNKEQRFDYKGNVEVIQGDMTLTSDLLEGYYDQNNEIQKLIARKNVLITKGENIRATGDLAEYEKATETVILTESPEIQQQGSILTADRVKIFLQEDRSVAEGKVRVKILPQQSKAP